MSQRTTQRLWSTALSAVLLAACATPPAPASEPHPEKAVYADQQSWPATAPGSVSLTGFHPFHAVYDREYTQSSGPGKGEKRRDRVIVYADEVAWEGDRAVAITLLDSGVAEHADTNARTMTMIAALDDLTLRFELGPVPGRAKDYYLGLVSGDEILLNNIETEAQTLQAQRMPTPQPGFGPGAWVMASMDLAVGKKIRLAPYYSPRASPISRSDYGRVIEQRTITDGSGDQHEAWVVETPGWYRLDHPKVLRFLLKDTPPYYLGTETYSHETGETSRFLWLRQSTSTAP